VFFILTVLLRNQTQRPSPQSWESHITKKEYSKQETSCWRNLNIWNIENGIRNQEVLRSSCLYISIKQDNQYRETPTPIQLKKQEYFSKEPNNYPSPEKKNPRHYLFYPFPIDFESRKPSHEPKAHHTIIDETLKGQLSLCRWWGEGGRKAVSQWEVGRSNAQPNEGESGGEALSPTGDARNSSGSGNVRGDVTSESSSCRQGSWEIGKGGTTRGSANSLRRGSRAAGGAGDSSGGWGARKGGGNANTVFPAESGSGGEGPCYGFVGKLFPKGLLWYQNLLCWSASGQFLLMQAAEPTTNSLLEQAQKRSVGEQPVIGKALARQSNYWYIS